MDMNELFKMGASLIEGNSDDATTGLDLENITTALSKILTHGDGNIDLASILTKLSSNGLGEIVGSWLGNGENKAIDPEKVPDLLGEERVSTFAQELGVGEESAKKALADALPQVIDRVTSGENNIVDQMMGGSGNPMDMLSKMFR
ncbi:YidB family protein [Sulfurovum sp. NBC37-1]|uniref:YidB family protein n=1 Tax=Sulfurovum sp. (strain NBC37-1) TaxID=387093 RepID=UPI0001587B72|nr:YidB family protein [Sulfurovum sp. NBC37-1]BAF72798.1 conserved hypothetical protein [Sulfurovum sp. NBC37-1]